MVILMAPVSAFAAVVAMAVPQRLAAESTLEESAADLAVLAAAWRDHQGRDDTPLDAFFGDCAARTQPAPGSPGDGTDGQGGGNRQNDPSSDADAMQSICEALSSAVLRDLGGHGFDPATLRGFYSASYATADTPASGLALPCSTGNRSETVEAVHLGLTARWDGPGWAAAQAMPQGVRMGAQAVGRVDRPATTGSASLPACGGLLTLTPPRLAPADPSSRTAAQQLAETVPIRTPFAG